MEDDDWDHLDFERDDHLEEFCRERLNRVSTIGGGVPGSVALHSIRIESGRTNSGRTDAILS